MQTTSAGTTVVSTLKATTKPAISETFLNFIATVSNLLLYTGIS